VIVSERMRAVKKLVPSQLGMRARPTVLCRVDVDNAGRVTPFMSGASDTVVQQYATGSSNVRLRGLELHRLQWHMDSVNCPRAVCCSFHIECNLQKVE
jgi:hypothetical protein